MKNEMIVLESVGGVLINGVVYAQYEMGGYDEESGVPLNECDEEWFDALDDADKLIVEKYNK